MKIGDKIFIAIILLAIIFPLTARKFAFAHDLGAISTIHMTQNGFEPGEVEIKIGDTVIFENTDSRDRWPASNIHPTHEIYPEFDPKKPVKPKGTWGFEFEKTGVWRFHDHLYPQFTGQITVKEPGVNQAKDPNLLSLTWQKIISIKNFAVKALSSIRVFSKDQSRKEQKVQEVGSLPDPSKIDLGALYKDINFTCPSQDYSCIANVLKNVTQANGPQVAISVLDQLLAKGKISKSIDDHQFAHEIGRETAKAFGYNAQSFLACPMSAYNGGCQHGFFENALGKSQNSKEAIDLVCGSLDDNFSSKFRFYCYHGVGHGVMMAQAYDLEKSLDICNSIGTNGTEGCWQGVFMENVNSALKNQAKEGVFSKEDPLSPCNKTENKYRYQCYINHSGYLMLFFGTQIDEAATACLKADDLQAPCLESLGLLATNPSWQMPIIHKQDAGDEVSVALEICSKFPAKTRNHCFIGALDNILNNDAMNLEQRAIKFCQKSPWDKKDCNYQIGINVARQVVSLEERRSLCQKTDSKFLESCFKGAGI